MMILTFAVLILSMLAVSYVFLVMPRVTDAADMDMQSTDYACGGLTSKNAPYGSVTAIKEAVALSYGIEVAVALSKDKKLFVLHSEDPSDNISNLPSASLCASGYITLSALLELIDGQVTLLLTLNGADALTCKKLCALLDRYHGAFAIQSFEPSTLSFFKNYRPRYARGQMICSKKSGKHPSLKASLGFWHRHLFVDLITRPDFISTEGSMIREPAFLIATKLFRRQGFVRNVKNQRQYSICKARGLYAIFERIRPQ